MGEGGQKVKGKVEKERKKDVFLFFCCSQADAEFAFLLVLDAVN